MDCNERTHYTKDTGFLHNYFITIHPPFDTKFSNAGVLKTAAALAAVIAREPPKYM